MALPPHRAHEISYLVEFSDAIAYAVPARYRDYDYQALARQVNDACPSLAYVLVAGEGVDRSFVDLRGMLHETADADEVRRALRQQRPDPSDVALFLLSGGTTGLPKLIPRTHDDYAYNARGSAAVCGFGPETVYMVVLPAGHNFPLGSPGILGVFHHGGRVVLAPTPSPEVALPLIERERVTVTSVVPAVAIHWMDAPLRASCDLSSLQVLQVGGARLNPEAARRVGPALGCRLQQVFGMAEGLLNFTRLDDPEEMIVSTQGRPMSPDDEVRVVDASGHPVSVGEAGELCTRGPCTVRGYYDAPEYNLRAFTPDGFYRSGDVVRMDAAGNFIVEGRQKDLINRAGEKVSAEEVENLILSHPAVFNVAVVAMPDPVAGERVCAYAVLHGGASLALSDLAGFLHGRGIAQYKLPERLEIIDALPLTGVGKVDKKALREDIAAKLARESGAAPG